MKYLKEVLTILWIMQLLFVAVQSTRCEGDEAPECPEGHMCCDDFNSQTAICYDPNTADCVAATTADGGQATVLCGDQRSNVHDLACGTVCYDPIDYVCCNGALFGITESHPCSTPVENNNRCEGENAPECPEGHMCCDDFNAKTALCYDPSTADCVPATTPDGGQATVLCGDQRPNIHDLACGTVCYDPIDYVCCNGALFGITESHPCSTPGGNNNNTNRCEGENAPECPEGHMCCDDFNAKTALCYDPSTADCVAATTPDGGQATVLCGDQRPNVHDLACGTVCYDPIDYVCCNGALFGITESHPCSNPGEDNNNRCEGENAPECPEGYMCCDDFNVKSALCYDPSTADCVPATTPDGGQATVLCGDQRPNVHDLACGTVCYDPIDYVCCNGALFGITESHPCSTPGGNNNNTNKCEGEDAPECPEGFMCCDDFNAKTALCYDPSTADCVAATTPDGGQATVLCGDQRPNVHDLACGTVCYDPIDYVCCNLVLFGITESHPCSTPGGNNNNTNGCEGDDAPECPEGFMCCDDFNAKTALCYDPSTADCVAATTPDGGQATVLCGDQRPNIHDLACGTVCYDPIDYVCCNGALFGITESHPCSTPGGNNNNTNKCEGDDAPECPEGFMCCDDFNAKTALCYDPSTADCVAATTPDGGQATVLCGDQRPNVHDLACGTVCYDPIDYVCCNGALFGITESHPCSTPGEGDNNRCEGDDAPECPEGYMCCDDFNAGTALCYDPSTADCVAATTPDGGQATVLCGDQRPNVHDLACGTVCYDPIDYVCCNGALFGITESHPCSTPGGNNNNTNNNTSRCEGEDAPECPEGFMCCDDFNAKTALCYDPSTADCVAATTPDGGQATVLCGDQRPNVHDLACGTVCYDPIDYVCCNGALFGITESHPCSGQSGNNNTRPSRCEGDEAPECPEGYTCCDDFNSQAALCYDPSTADCVAATTPDGGQATVLCGDQRSNVHDVACGTVCYDPVDYVCCNGAIFGINEATPCN